MVGEGPPVPSAPADPGIRLPLGGESEAESPEEQILVKVLGMTDLNLLTPPSLLTLLSFLLFFFSFLLLSCLFFLLFILVKSLWHVI